MNRIETSRSNSRAKVSLDRLSSDKVTENKNSQRDGSMTQRNSIEHRTILPIELAVKEAMKRTG